MYDALSLLAFRLHFTTPLNIPWVHNNLPFSRLNTVLPNASRCLAFGLLAFGSLAFSTIIMSVSASAAPSDYFDNIEWQLKRDKRGIQVYTGKVPNSKYRAVFSTMQLQADPVSVAALLLDLPNCRQWASMCKEAKVETRVDEHQSIVYGLNDLPFPLRDRDSYSRVVWSFDDESGVIAMDSESLAEDAYPRRKGVIRIDSAHAGWRIVPMGDGNVIVENYVHVDPNGKVPTWATNMLIVDGPYKALRKMRALLTSGEYLKAKVAFLPTQSKPTAADETEPAPPPD